MHSPHRAFGRRLRVLSVLAAVGIGLGAILAPTAAHAAAITTVDDEYIVHSGVTFTAEASAGWLANDDIEVGPYVFVDVISNPTQASNLTYDNDGSFSYTSKDGFVGDETFTYCIKTGPIQPCDSAEATVTLHVTRSIGRVDGSDRYAVSAGVSASGFAPGVTTAYIASGEVFPDALSASAAAGADGAPVLLVARDGVPAVIAAELIRLKPKTIMVLGGTNTVTESVETELRAYATRGVVIRIGGADRYAVSAGISHATFDVTRPIAYIASGDVFPDALSGSAAAGNLGGPVLLVQKNAIPPVVATELARLRPDKIVVLGGANSVADSVVTTLQAIAATSRVAGADRFEVSANVSTNAFLPELTNTVYIASGEVFPDALSGAAAAIAKHAPVLLVTKNAVSAQVAAELERLEPARIVVLGGTNTISDALYAELESHLG